MSHFAFLSPIGGFADGRGTAFNAVTNVIFDRIKNLYRLDFHFISSSHFPQRGKQEK